MNCAEFEQGLARVIAEEPAKAGRRELLAALCAHTAGCAACALSRDLITVLDLPQGQRDIVDDPGPDYWSGFSERLAPRLTGRPESRRIFARALWIAAAVIAVALVAGSILRGPGDAGPIEADGGSRRVAVAAEASELPASLVSSVSNASVEDVEDQLTVLEGWSSDSLYPDVERLDAETQEQLLDWLRDENSRLEGAKG